MSHVRHLLRLAVAVVATSALLALTASQVDPAISIAALSVQAVRNGGVPAFGPERLTVIDVPLETPVVPGVLDPANGRAVLATLDLAMEGIRRGWFGAMATAPLQKSTINDAGIAFSGHTEYLADKTGTPKVVMMLAGPLAGAALAVAVAGLFLILVPLFLVGGLVARFLLRGSAEPMPRQPSGRPDVIEGRYEVVELREGDEHRRRG